MDEGVTPGCRAEAVPLPNPLLWATAASLVVLLAFAGPTRADQTGGRVFGRATDPVTGGPLPGLTIVAQGPQGENATLSDENGDYVFAGLPVGNYTLVVYAPGAPPVERTGIVVSADKALRVNLQVANAAARTETFVVERRAPMVDLGAARTGLTLRRDDLVAVPAGTTFGEAVNRAPRAFFDGSGSVSIAGASGLENVYLVDGLNVTGIEYGDILSGRPNSSGGSNLPVEFLDELSISSGGYAAEYGGAMGGVVSAVTKSGSNEFHASAFSRLMPSDWQGDPYKIRRAQSALVGSVAPGTQWQLGAEVGGPILRNRLFFWLGFAPESHNGTFVRGVEARADSNQDGLADRNAAGDFITTLVAESRKAESRLSTPFGGKLTFVPRPEQRFNLSVFSTFTKSVRAYDRTGADAVAAADPAWAMQKISKRNTDVNLTWDGHFFDRRWRIETQLGLHDERFRDRSPDPALDLIQQNEWYGVGLFDAEGIAGCQPVMNAAGTFDPCPADLYRNAGYGATRSYSGQRWVAELKSTHLFSALGAHELKYGAHVQLSVLDQTRHFSGPLGSRGLFQNSPDGNLTTLSFFSLPPGRYPFQFSDSVPGNLDPNMDGSPAELAAAPYYRDALKARVKNFAPALFLQDSYTVAPNLTMLLGGRYEKQRLYDFRGEPFADLDNLAFRAGVLYDPTNEGRAKLFGHYGRFYEAVPLNLAVRYFGGEGILVRNSQNPPPFAFFNNGTNYPVQPNLRGQSHDEIVLGFQYEVLTGSLLGIEYTRRWLGAVIEDGTATDGTFVLANPGQVPESALQAAQADIDAKMKEVATAAPADRAARETELGALQSRYDNLKGLGQAPRPERTYNALTLSLTQRLGQRLSVQAWYTYARLFGNYNGLYDQDNNYFAPNGGNAYDTPDLVLNKRGPLANDRPHAARVTGHYTQPVGGGALVGGLSFSAFSGVPRNHVSALFPGQQLVFLLPRGSAGRTPTVTQLDAKLGYRHQVARWATFELALELFNVLDRRTPLRQDDNYTYDPAAAIVGGNSGDLPHAKNAAGGAITPNTNFGRATAYQAPFHGRLALRAFF
ncbi:MAG TPA: TonB-dependent receptor [Polyangia bacterium]